MSVIVIGSGIAGVNAALTLLEKGKKVELWDVGFLDNTDDQKLSNIKSNLDFKKELNKPYEFFYGKNLNGIISPGSNNLFSLPENRNYYLKEDSKFWNFNQNKFDLVTSLSMGGLANGWGANSIPFNDDDISDWPISFSDLYDDYKRVYSRIDVTKSDDELSPFYNEFGNQENIKLEPSDEYILNKYNRKKKYFNEKKIILGKARLAITNDKNDNNFLSRPLWVSNEKIYNPIHTLRKCKEYKNFKYLNNRLIKYLIVDEDHISGINYFNTLTKKIINEKINSNILLAAGAIQSGSIYLNTLKKNDQYEILNKNLTGLMDTSVVKIFYSLPRMLGSKYLDNNYQFNRLIAGVINENNNWPSYLHCEMLNLNDLTYHPLIEKLPFGSFLSKELFFSLRKTLGVMTLFFPDKLNKKNHLSVNDKEEFLIDLNYQENDEKKIFIKKNTLKVKNALLRLGAIPFMVKAYKPGSGIHYAGTIPMGKKLSCDSKGKSNFFNNLYIADSSAFPSLPSKPISINTAAYASYVASNLK